MGARVDDDDERKGGRGRRALTPHQVQWVIRARARKVALEKLAAIYLANGHWQTARYAQLRREIRGLTWRALAQALQISHQTLVKAVAGERYKEVHRDTMPVDAG